jgi:hypothetical protein
MLLYWLIFSYAILEWLQLGQRGHGDAHNELPGIIRLSERSGGNLQCLVGSPIL